MRISIVGAGAMGSLMAGRLTAARIRNTDGDPAAIVLYGRPSAHLEAIRNQGLRLTERDGRVAIVKVRATSDPSAVQGSDVVLVLVKSWASAEAVRPLRSFLTRDVVVLTLQNGLGNAALLRGALLAKGVRPHVWLGVTTQAAIRTEPGAVVHTGDGITVIGRRSQEVTGRLREIATALTEGDLQTIAVEDIHRWVWRKLAVNAAINPLTALAGVQNAAITADSALRAAAATLTAEVVAVANANKVSIDVQEVLAAVDGVARATGVNRSSMLVDLETGLRTEIDAINGAIVAEGKRLRVKTPANQLMVALVRAREGLGDMGAKPEPDDDDEDAFA